MAEVGAAALPVLVGLILLFGYVKGVPVFDTFLSGAKEKNAIAFSQGLVSLRHL